MKENLIKFWKYIKLNATYSIITIVLALAISMITYLLFMNHILGLWYAYLFYISTFLTSHMILMFYKKKRSNTDNGIPLPGKISHFFDYVYMRILWLFAVFGLIAFFFVYHNDIKPAEVPSYKLINKTTWKEVYFQGMVHIGKNKFYETVNDRIKSYSNSWYTLYFEGVQADSEKDMEKLADNIGIKPTTELYDNIWKALGSDIGGQDNMDLINSSKKAVNADVSVAELIGKNDPSIVAALPVIVKDNTWSLSWVVIKKHSEVKSNTWVVVIAPNVSSNTWTINTGAIISSTWSITETITPEVLTEKQKLQKEVNKQLNDDLASLAESDNQTLSYALRGLFNFVIKNDWLQAIALKQQSTSENGSVFFKEKVLDFRNEKLAKFVVDGKDQKIFITYGAMHFPGFLEEINKLSTSKWEGVFEITKVETTRPF